jgi:hypothetical protein
MNLKSIKIIIAGLVLVMLTMLPYYYFLNKGSISSSTTIWGEFGSYLAGVASLLTFFATIYIALIIDKNTTERHLAELEMQRKLFINNLRYNEYKNLISQLNISSYIFVSDEKPDRTIYELEKMKNVIRGFCIKNNLLFPILDDVTLQEPIINSIDKVQLFLRENWNTWDLVSLKGFFDLYIKDSDIFCKKLFAIAINNQ